MSHCHIQHISDALATHGHFKGFPVVARSLANLTRDSYIGQELHLYLVVAFALTGLTAATFHVKGKPTRRITSHTGLRQTSEQVPDGRKCSGIGGRVTPRGAADGRLVDVYNLIHTLHTKDFFVCPGKVPPFVDELVQPLIKNLID